MTSRRRDWQRRSRRQLVWAVGVFLLMQQAGGALIDYARPDLRFPVAHQQLDGLRHTPAPEIVYFGSSRLLTSLSAHYLNVTLQAELGDGAPTVLDAAVPGGDPIVMEWLFGELQRRGARPKLVVFEVLPESFQRRNERCRMHVHRHFTWKDLPVFHEDLWFNRQMGQFWRGRLLPLYQHRYAVVKECAETAACWAGGAEEPDGPTRRWRLEQEPAVLAKAARGRAPLVHNVSGVLSYLRDFEVGGGNVAALNRVLARCQAEGCAVLLLSPPVSKAHRGCYTQAIEAAFQDNVKALEERYACRFVDCRGALLDTLFVDHHHGAPDGAFVFSCRLGRNVLGPEYRRVVDGPRRDEPWMDVSRQRETD
jgi:hypothetical protein